MKRILLFAAAALLAGQASAGPWVTSVDTAQKKAKAQHRLIFVDLWADWCGWCHKFEQEVIPSQAFQSATDDMVLLRLNTEDGKEGTKLARDYRVMSLPTFVVLDEDMLMAGQIRGFAPANDFARLLKDTLTHYQEFQKRVSSEASFAKDFQKRLDLVKEYRERTGLTQSESRASKLLLESGVPPNIRDEAYYEVAISQFLQKRYDDSQKTLKKFATVQTQGDAFERSRLLVGDIYLSQGNLMAAANEYRNFKKIYPKSQYIRNVDMVLPQVERQLQAQPQAQGKK